MPPKESQVESLEGAVDRSSTPMVSVPIRSKLGLEPSDHYPRRAGGDEEPLATKRARSHRRFP